uniref:FHIPEP family type III secretion protein n=1 Tax=Candidatus Paracaedibacter symbiosus TaxID=244582 RepID=UPI0018DDCF9F
LGFVMPRLQTSLRPELDAHAYEILVQGHRAGSGVLVTDKVLAINPGGTRPRLEGSETRDPAYGLPAQWVDPEIRKFARGAGYTLVEPDTVLITHLNEVVKQRAPELLTRQETERMLKRMHEQCGALVDELVPNILTYSDVQKTLQLLLREQVSVRNLEAILEVLVDAGRTIKAPDELAERIRERLGPSICQRFNDAQGELQVLTLAPDTERALMVSQRAGETSRGALFTDMGQLDGFVKHLARQSEAMMGRSLNPVLLCPPSLRRPLRSLIQRSLPHVAVVSLSEVPSNMMVRSFASVGTNP